MKYAAFIRGVGPANPNMHQDKFNEFFKKLGFKNVITLQSSGNVIFESDEEDKKSLENLIESRLPQELGFSRTTIIRNREELKDIILSNPFNGAQDLPNSRLNVTFLKNGGEVFSIIDTVNVGTTKTMASLEKKYGKEITMRTWKTVERIIKKMEESQQNNF